MGDAGNGVSQEGHPAGWICLTHTRSYIDCSALPSPCPAWLDLADCTEGIAQRRTKTSFHVKNLGIQCENGEKSVY